MIIPIRCFSCGKVSKHLEGSTSVYFGLKNLQVTGDLWERYLQLIADPRKTDGFEDFCYSRTRYEYLPDARVVMQWTNWDSNDTVAAA